MMDPIYQPIDELLSDAVHRCEQEYAMYKNGTLEPEYSAGQAEKFRLLLETVEWARETGRGLFNPPLSR